MSNYFVKQSRLTPGSSEPSIYVLLTSDNDKNTWSTGNNATFLNGGVVAGAFVKQDLNSPLNGSTSYTFTQAAGSLNDWVATPVLSVPLRARGVTNRTNLVYTYDGATNDIRFIVYDVTNSTRVTSLTNYVENSTVGKQVELIYDLPSTCTQVRFGIQVAVANNGKVLKFDDIQMSDSPFSVANLVIQESVSYTGYSSGTNPLVFATKDTLRSNNNLLVAVSTVGSAGTCSRYTILQQCQVVVQANNYMSTNTSDFYIQHYNSAGTMLKQQGIASSNTSVLSVTASVTTKANVGDYFVCVNSVGPSNNVTTNFSITATALSSNIIQSWNDGTEWTSLTYTQVNALTGNQGLGTFTGGTYRYRRDGSDLLIQGHLIVGTTTASEARIPYPSGLISDSILSNYSLGGTWGVTFASSFTGFVLTEPSKGYFTLTRQSSTTDSTTKMLGNAILSTGNYILFEARTPIAGWSSKPQLIGLPTATQTEYYIEAAGNAGQSITANVTDIPFIATTQNNATWSGSSFTAPITGNYEICGGITISVAATFAIEAYVNTVKTKRFASTFSATSGYLGFSGKVYLTAGQTLSLRSTASSTLVNDTVLHNLSITRLNGKNDGVYVGQLSGQWQYDLVVTGTNWTTTRAVGVVYKTDSGTYRMKFNIAGSVTSGTRTGYTIAISGVTFGSAYQVVTGDANAAATVLQSYTEPSNGNITCTHTSATTTYYRFSNDVELSSKPTFAVSTP